VQNNVGRSTSSATPIQKREKRSALIKETSTVASVKEAKSARGVKERTSWIRRKD